MLFFAFTALAIADDTAPLKALYDEAGIAKWNELMGKSDFRPSKEYRKKWEASGNTADIFSFNWQKVYGRFFGMYNDLQTWEPYREKALLFRAETNQPINKAWLDKFIKACDAVKARNENDFTNLVRELDRTLPRSKS